MLHDKDLYFYWFVENPIDIESLAGISEIEDNQIRPTTAEWLQNLTASVSRPSTTIISEVHDEQNDNPQIIDLNQATNASFSSSRSNSLGSITEHGRCSSDYLPSFHENTRPTRRHLFAGIGATASSDIPDLDASVSNTRASTSFSLNPCSPNVCTLNSPSETIINVASLQSSQVDPTYLYQFDQQCLTASLDTRSPVGTSELTDGNPDVTEASWQTTRNTDNSSGLNQTMLSQMRDRVIRHQRENHPRANRAYRLRRDANPWAPSKKQLKHQCFSQSPMLRKCL